MADFVGTPGDDTLSGTSGADTMSGLGGNDIYIIDDAGDQVFENAGGGIDIVYSAVSYSLNDGSEVEDLATLDWGATTAINLTGNALANYMIGNDGANQLDGKGGADVMIGRGGHDIYIVDNAGDQVFENTGGGIDIVYTAISYALAEGPEIESLSTIDWGATTAINLTGNALANYMNGNDGANQLDGKAGADVMIGRGGHDIYLVDNAGDQVFENAGGGIDIIYTAISYALAEGQEIESLSTIDWGATTAINLTGNGLANYMNGNDGSNQLDGKGGADVMIGRGGADTYIVDNAGDQAIEDSGGGIDMIYTAVSYALNDGSEVEGLATLAFDGTAPLNLSGNGLGNYMIANDGANQLDGKGGADVMVGRAGHDVYLVDNAGDQAIENAGGGIDIIYTAVSYALSDGQEVESLSTIDWGATNAIDLTGNAAANHLNGNAGANILDGKGGIDVLQGREGADTFAFTTALGAGNIDNIQDFSVADDMIRLGGNAGEPFAALASGALAASAFAIGAAAADANDVLIYNDATGAVFYDADGSGAVAAVQFATLPAGLSLTAADFTVSGPENRPPEFTSPTTVTIAENSPVDAIVYQAAATDADGDRITYSLGGIDANLLTLDANGAVRLKAPADFETRPSYSFTLFASDSGPNSAVRNVTMTVTNVNEGTPIVAETAAANDAIGAAQVLDRNMLAVAANPNLPDDALPSATVQGAVSAVSDKDFFAITLQAGELLLLDVDNSGGNLDSMVRVFSAAGVELASNDDLFSLDPGSPAHPNYGHNTDSLVRFRAPSAGTYYFSIESLQDPPNPTFGSYELHVSIGPPATEAQLLDEDIDALISGARWPGTALTYAFPTSVGQYPGNIPETTPASDFAPFTAVQQQATTQLLQLVANVSSLTFALGNPSSAHVRFAMSSEADPAYAYYPPTGSGLGGTAWFSKQDFNNPVKGGYAWMAILHEAGHTLGVKHSHESPAVSAGRDSLEYTVMSYRSYIGASIDEPDDGYSNETWGYPQTLMMLDTAALQRVYGANFSYNSTDTTYRWSPATGEFSINGFGQGAPGGNRVFMTLWDGGGTDTYDLSNYSFNLTIDLRPGEWTRLGGAQLANLGDGHSARGNIANALLVGGDTRSLIENAVGGSGADTLVGNQARNLLTGNGGFDQFAWRSIEDAGLGTQADVITDFARDPERIDLSGIDAVSAAAGDQAFSFIGPNGFSGIAGQLRTQVEGNSIRVQGDVNGDSAADFEIVVANQTILFHSDFFL